MRKFLSVFKWVLLAVAILLLLGPTVLKRINQIRDEKKIENLVLNPFSIEIEALQAANTVIEESQQAADDPFDEQGKAKEQTSAETNPAETRLLTTNPSETNPSITNPAEQPAENRQAMDLIAALRNIDHVNAAIIIPKIEVKAPVYYGTGHDVLSIGTGFIEGTVLPFGKKGEHAFIAGHRGTYYVKTFVDLGKLELLDRFSLLLGDILFVYEINEIKIIRPWEFDPYTNDPEKSLLTLFTCDPIPSFENRLLVTGELIAIVKIDTNSDLDELTLTK